MTGPALGAGLPVLLCAAALAALLAARARGAAAAGAVAKTLASAAFLWAALRWGALASGYGRAVLLALALCAAGDVLLIPRGRRLLFALGLGAFGLGHLAYSGAFLLRTVEGAATGLGGLAAAAAALGLGRALLPRVEAPLRAPVAAYLAVIALMLALAAGTFAAAGDARIPAGALLFALSDLFVARERFVAAGFANPALGLPLYYAGQLLLAASVR